MTIAYTLVNIAYLPMAKTLADSFIRHNPDIPFYICLFDDKKDIVDAMFLDYNIYDKNNLDKNEYDDMRSRYDNFSMACALKPYFAEALLRNYNPDSIIYLDADLMFFNSLEKLRAILDESQKSIILTGHQYKIIKSDTELSSNQSLRKYGIFNAGFFALKNNVVGNGFIDWWKRILFTKCIRDDSKGIYYDQTWLDLVPMYFGDHCFVLKDLGYNVAFWNLQERNVSVRDGKYLINDNYPLVFYHFARYKYYNSDFIDGFTLTFEKYQTIQIIFNDYKKILKLNLYEHYLPYQPPRKITFREKIKISLQYRLPRLIDKL